MTTDKERLARLEENVKRLPEIERKIDNIHELLMDYIDERVKPVETKVNEHSFIIGNVKSYIAGVSSVMLFAGGCIVWLVEHFFFKK